MREFIRSRRDPEVPPGERSPTSRSTRASTASRGASPTIRWLLSTVPSAMIFDDHDVHDDWNTSIDVGRPRCARRAGGTARIVGGFMSYWIYQHLGNLSPARAGARTSSSTACARPSDDRRRSCATSPTRADREVEGTRWSYCRDIGPARRRDDRLARRARARARARARWSTRTSGAGSRSTRRGDCRPPADRHLAAAAPGARAALPGGVERGGLRRRVGPRRGARLGEKLRQGARPRALGGVRRLVRADVPSCCARSAPASAASAPATIVVLSGDVHHAYLAEVGFAPGTGVRSRGLAGRLLAVPQPARQARAAGDAHRGRRAGGRPSTRALAAPPACAPPQRALALSSTTSPGSTTRSRCSSSTGRRATFVLEKTARPTSRTAAWSSSASSSTTRLARRKP